MKLLLILAILIVGARAAEPVKEIKPTPPGESPEEIAHRYIRAMADQHLNVVADAMHPDALVQFQGILGRIADAIAAAPADRKPPEKMISALFGEPGLAAVKTDAPRDVFVRFMSNLMTFLPQVREMTAGSEYQVLGHVEEGNLAHVVFRATLRRGEAEVTKMDVLSLKRDGERWKVLLTDDLAGVVAGLGRQLASPPQEKPATPQPKFR
ncbi:MAG: hypothetical protein ABMA13_08135 [Chthoniobacteraceae bacterium]